MNKPLIIGDKKGGSDMDHYRLFVHCYLQNSIFRIKQSLKTNRD